MKNYKISSIVQISDEQQMGEMGFEGMHFLARTLGVHRLRGILRPGCSMGLHTPLAGWLVLPVPEDGDFKFLMQPAVARLLAEYRALPCYMV